VKLNRLLIPVVLALGTVPFIGPNPAMAVPDPILDVGACGFLGGTEFEIDTTGKGYPEDATFEPILNNPNRIQSTWSWMYFTHQLQISDGGTWQQPLPVPHDRADDWQDGWVAYETLSGSWYDRTFEFTSAELFQQFVIDVIGVNFEWSVVTEYELVFRLSSPPGLGPPWPEPEILDWTLCEHRINFVVISPPPPPDVSYCGFSNNNRGSLEELIACKTPSELPGTI